jgi:hypothetical protein
MGRVERHHSGAFGNVLGNEMGNARKHLRKPLPRQFLDAIESGDIKRVERLIAKGANIHGELWRESPTSCAIRFGQTHIVALLIRHGIDVRQCDDAFFSAAAAYQRQAILKLLATTVFVPDLWSGKSRAGIEKQADLIYQNVEKDLRLNFPDPLLGEQLSLARLELFDAAMTCWEQVRPDPPRITISKTPAKLTPL